MKRKLKILLDICEGIKYLEYMRGKSLEGERK
jgi:hypothetical protein